MNGRGEQVVPLDRLRSRQTLCSVAKPQENGTGLFSVNYASTN